MAKNELSQHVTTKKVKAIGTETYINVATGEAEEFQVTKIEERDFNFTKVWIRNFVATLDLVGNQKTRLVYWIIDNLNHNNQLICTNRLMAEETGISLATVSVTMKALQDANFLKKQANGVYVINPDILFKGTQKARLNILNQFSELGAEPQELSDEQKIQNITKTIAQLSKQLEALQSKSSVVDTEIEGQYTLLPDGSIVQKAVNKKE
uniref:Plasmid replication control protein n=1 Tax=Butyrivibrio fibrisolvens TaxID=831 RepID=Q52051_BUTFI|nr:plasmid replication control protein [Butyrivibrio fibrisolvens]